MSEAALNNQSYNYCGMPLADYACRPEESIGRVCPEEESRYRTCFQRDRDRIIHSGAFRRLKNKTQVFVYHQGNNYRTRLTHTLEVSQITRSLARALMVNEDLAETVALAHDLGHPPFAHAGEEILNECMEDYGGFDHNDQSLRILTFLERKYPRFLGLNLTWETLEGVVKHNGPLCEKGQSATQAGLPITITQTDKDNNWRLDEYASIEAQIAAIADDIAYNSHDVEDGLFAGLFDISDLAEVRLIHAILDGIEKKNGKMEGDMLTYQLIRDLIGELVQDVLNETLKRLTDLSPHNADDIRGARQAMVAFSPEMNDKVTELRKFLWDRMYKHYTVCRTMAKGTRIIKDLYSEFMSNTQVLPTNWQERLKAEGDGSDEGKARIIADYIASMTDHFAIKEHERIFEAYWDLR